MSCSGCTKTDGCEANKGPQRTLIDEVFDRVYPGRTWGVLDDEARFGAGLRPSEIQRLGRALSTATRAPTFYRPGEPDDLCDYIYILCVGRTPALVEVREGGIPIEADRVVEQYLRVACSSLARMATVQEVGLELEREGNQCFVRELPRPGVYDPKLLKRMRKVVDLIEANDIEHLDFGMVDKPAPDTSPADYVERYGVEPSIVNFLFYAQPARTNTTTLVTV